MRRHELPELQDALAGLGVHAHHRVVGPVDGGGELLVVVRRRAGRALGAVGRRVVVVVRVLGPQPVGQRAQPLGEVRVGPRGVGEQGVAAEGRQHHGAQRGEGRRAVDERHVGVPAVGLVAVLGVDGQDGRLLLAPGDRRVGGGERAEAPDEAGVRAVVEVVLAPHDHELVLEDRRPQRGDLVLGHVGAEPQPGDLGAERPGDAADVGGRGDRHGVCSYAAGCRPGRARGIALRGGGDGVADGDGEGGRLRVDRARRRGAGDRRAGARRGAPASARPRGGAGTDPRSAHLRRSRRRTTHLAPAPGAIQDGVPGTSRRLPGKQRTRRSLR